MQCNHADSDPLVDRDTCRRLGISSVIAAPITSSGSVIGLIEVFSRDSYAFDDVDRISLAKLSETLAATMAGLPSTQPTDGELKEPEAGLGLAPPPPETGQPLDANQVFADLACGENPSQPTLTSLASYRLSGPQKLMVYRRAALWFVAAVLLAGGLWFSFGTSLRWWSNAASANARSPQSHSRDPIFREASVRDGASLSEIPRAHDSLEEMRQLAEHGDPNAELQLGATYASAQDNAENNTEAVKWLTRSANHGNVTAAASLGAFYWAGRGVTQGYVGAYMWSAIAEAGGDEASSYRVAILQSRMSTMELADARRRTEAWLGTHGKEVALRQGAPTHR
jgi:hypothetical protein